MLFIVTFWKTKCYSLKIIIIVTHILIDSNTLNYEIYFSNFKTKNISYFKLGLHSLRTYIILNPWTFQAKRVNHFLKIDLKLNWLNLKWLQIINYNWIVSIQGIWILLQDIMMPINVSNLNYNSHVHYVAFIWY